MGLIERLTCASIGQVERFRNGGEGGALVRCRVSNVPPISPPRTHGGTARAIAPQAQTRCPPGRLPAGRFTRSNERP